MRKYEYGFCSDIGIRKSVNQDSLSVLEAVVEGQLVILAIICDGMGGLSKGELASASVIHAFGKWFKNDLAATHLDLDTIQTQWGMLVKRSNEMIWNYGSASGIQLGTTLTAMLIIGDSQYFIGHVGDSRAYIVTNGVQQLTEDQTFVAREIKRGNMTPEQAETDPRRNVLLQCIGASHQVEPDFIRGYIEPGSGFLLCSDGFRHVISEEEVYNELSELRNNYSRDQIDVSLRKLIDLNMSRGETDNITAVFLQQVEA